MPDFQAEPKAIPKPFPEVAVLSKFFKECTPKILVVTDGLSFDGTDFGLLDFVNTLKATTIHGMTPIVETAHTGATAADHTSFKFTASNFNIKKYDVLFLFGVSSGPALETKQVDVITQFMQDGGGVFATGDHAELGKALCNGIPRVNKMRYWSSPDVPSADGTDRISTNLPGANDIYEFDDQSDAIPQRLYPKYYLNSPADPPQTSKPHYLLQHPTKKIIEVLPDHPHEGECVVPTSLAGSITVGGSKVPEWPKASFGLPVIPELIALSMSAGGGFPGKAPLVPRSFGAIGAYDGHRAKVGRISVDATWHHFININLVATFAGPGLQANPDALDRVHTYFRNIAEWLMPKQVRKCLRWPLLRAALELYPAREIIPFPPGDPLKDPEIAQQLGGELRATLARFMTPAAVQELEADILELQGEELAQLLNADGSESFAQRLALQLLPIDTLRRVALGAAVHAVANVLPLGGDLEKDAERAGGIEGIEKTVQGHVGVALQSFSRHLREGTGRVEQLCGVLGR